MKAAKEEKDLVEKKEDRVVTEEMIEEVEVEESAEINNYKVLINREHKFMDQKTKECYSRKEANIGSSKKDAFAK
jgi:hypothetical protein